jgi:hypothetical protein
VAAGATIGVVDATVVPAAESAAYREAAAVAR